MNDCYTYPLTVVTFQKLPEYLILTLHIVGKANKIAFTKAGYPVEIFIVKTLLLFVVLDVHE